MNFNITLNFKGMDLSVSGVATPGCRCSRDEHGRPMEPDTGPEVEIEEIVSAPNGEVDLTDLIMDTVAYRGMRTIGNTAVLDIRSWAEEITQDVLAHLKDAFE